MAMEIYGYRRSDDDGLLELREVSICVDASEAAALSAFFARCARAIETNPAWEHEHFSGENAPDLIVVNASAVPKKK